jgi:hypothetical protein
VEEDEKQQGGPDQKKHDVRCMRVAYLTALNKYREEGHPIV